MTLILCGLPCSGKTTLAQLLSQIHSIPCIDLDAQIEMAYFQNTGRRYSRSEIFTAEGSAFFRNLEATQVLLLSNTPPSVISLGGGTLDNEHSANHLKKIGTLYYLQASPELLWQRILVRGIPPYLDPQDPYTSFLHLAQKRIPILTSHAAQIIPTDSLSPSQIAEKCTNW